MKKFIMMATVPFTLLIVGILLSSCASYVIVEKSLNFNTNREKIKMITLNPSFTLYDARTNQKNKDINERIVKGEEKFNHFLAAAASQAGVELGIVDKDHLGPDDLSYFNILTALEAEIYTANFTQNPQTGGNRKSNSFRSFIKVPESVFHVVPKISSEYSSLVNRYNTKYFAVHGVTTFINTRNKKKTYYYKIVVDIESTEVVYRELRKFNLPPNNNNLGQVIYDSFKIFKNSYKK